MTAAGIFTDETGSIFQTAATGDGIDVEAADYNRDGLPDLYLCGFGQADALYLSENAVTAIKGEDAPVGTGSFFLLQNYPNPFNLFTTITYVLPEKSNVSLKIFNLAGKEIITLVHDEQSPGYKSVTWDGRNQSGHKMPSGVYFYHLKTEHINQTRKMFLVRSVYNFTKR